ncbi:DUF484 family protein [Amaricoccus sp.]|uniref:DUF484 family protein n=1 Tax=Amaricoccus sp. TaxID=1872485 RepID=UPI00260B0258|nr:DUF484 family protein [Amaricoccus sp.]HRO12683.1 DUF484 family protein [Amaricoccus sp.]
MSTTEPATLAIREQILSDPGLILEDHELMRALLAADRSAMGRNVVDLRGVLVDRLEERLDRLEDTHREVLAAAYENVAGMNQVHRACLALLEPDDFTDFLRVLTHDVAPILAVEVIRLGLEAPAAEPGAGLGPEGPCRDVVVALPAGGVDRYVTQGRGLGARRVTLRQLRSASPDFYGAEAPEIRSEALVRLGLGDGGGGHPALLAFGAHDANRFHPDQGTDLLAFFGGVFERSLRRWLA